MMSETVHAFITDHANEAFALLKKLAAIPAPSNHEEKRAAFILAWLQRQGAKDVFIDENLNVVYPVGCTETNPVVVFMAHQDVVFPDTTPLAVVVEGEKIKAPGIGDDTANLVALLLVMKYVAQTGIQPKDGKGVLLVANSGEEGLGNLRGSRGICERYGSRIEAFFSFDGTFDFLCNNAVGSRRYQVTIKTEGGHSYGAFGNKNAIAYLASMIDTLYRMKVPEGGKTTYNVGVITGGTSVNTIAQKASMLYEYRSDLSDNLAIMERQFKAVVAAYRAMRLSVSVKLVGERPCTGDVDRSRLDVLTKQGMDALKTYAGVTPQVHSGSTDCNIPLSLGIPSLCLGCLQGAKAHTYEEWVDIASLPAGYHVAFAMILPYFA